MFHPPQRTLALALALLFAAPPALAALAPTPGGDPVAPAGAGGALPSLDDAAKESLLRHVFSGILAPALEGQGIRFLDTGDDAVPHPGDAPASAARAEATNTSEPPRLESPHSGETVWVNNTTVVTGELWIPANATVHLQDAVLLVEANATHHPNLYVGEGGALIVDNSTIRPMTPDPQAYYEIMSGGRLDAYNSRLESAATYLAPEGPDGVAVLARCTFPGAPRAVSVTGPNVTLTENLFYNYSGSAAVHARDGARVEGNTFVHNNIGVRVTGENTTVTGNVFRFNLFGVWWDGTPRATVTGNNIHDNYVDGVYGNGKDGAGLDVSGNWWDGTPNVDGDTYDGTGVTSSSSRAAPAPVPDRVAELPFTLHVVKGDTTWPEGATLDGPLVIRAGTLTITGGTLDTNGYRFGSHKNGSFRISNAVVTDYGYLLSRGSDVLDGVRFLEGGGMGVAVPHLVSARGGIALLAIQGAPVVRNSVFDGVPIAVLQIPRILIPPDRSVSITVEGSTFRNTGLGVFSILATPTIRGNTIDGAVAGIITLLDSNVALTDNLVTNTTIGVLDALSQGFTATGNSIYDSTLGLLLILTTSPTVSAFEGRFNGLAFLNVGSQLTLANSNVYDNPMYGIYAVSLDLGDVQYEGRVTVDATTYVGDATRGSVNYVPPRKTAPGPTPGRTANLDPVVVASGETREITGPFTAPGPVIVRGGGTLTMRGAVVDLGAFVLGAQPGARIVIDGSTITGGKATILHSGDAVVQNSTFAGASFTGLMIVDAHVPTPLARNRFLDAPTGLDLWNTVAVVEESFFGSTVGAAFTNDTWPRTGNPTVRNSVFRTTGDAVQGRGNPDATLTGNAFRAAMAIDNTQRGFLNILGVSQGTGVIDARGNWFDHTTGPTIGYDGAGAGAEVRWRFGGPQTVLYEDWLTAPWRAAFTTPKDVVTTKEVVPFTDASFNLDDALLTRSWDFGDGSPNETGPNPVHAFEAHGNVTVNLTVEDAYGWVTHASRTLVVKAVPEAQLTGPSEVLSLENATFDASNTTDADGNVTAYRFLFSDGVDSGWIADAAFTRAFETPGNRTLTVTAKDDEGYVSVPTTLNVSVLNRDPVANFTATPEAPTRADAVTFTSTSMDADGTLDAIQWDFGDGTGATGAVVTHQFADVGTFTVRVTVTDDHGATATREIALPVVNARPVPAFEWTPRIPEPNETATFTSTAWDPDGESVSVAWTFPDGSTSTAATVTRAFPEESEYSVTLTVTDADGASENVTHVVTVRANRVPVAAFDAHTLDADTDATFTFTDASTDEDGDIVAWAWETGDGTAITGSPTVEHRYAHAGVFPVTLTVTDDRGASTTATRTVTVDDVLAARVRIVQPGSASDHVVLRVDSAWTNGTAVPAAFDLEVHYRPAAGAGTAVYRTNGTTNADGTAYVSMPPLGLFLWPPGKYVAVVTMQTTAGFAGNLESASAQQAWTVKP